MSEKPPTKPTKAAPKSPAETPVWVVMQTGLAMNKDTGRTDRRGRPVTQTVTLDPNRTYVLSEAYAAPLLQRGYCRPADASDFPNSELPEAKVEAIVC